MYSVANALDSLVSCGCTAFWVLLLVLGVVFLIKIFATNKYAEDSVVERWSALLPGQVDKESDYLANVEEALQARKLPYSVHRERIAVSLASSDSYDFTTSQMNADYSCFVSCITQGADLHVSWLLQDHMIKGIFRIPILGPLLLSIMKRYTFAMGNKVRAFATVTHSCAVEAAEKIMDEANLDKSKLNRKTSGKLGPL